MFKRVFIIALSIIMLIGMGGCKEKTEKIETKKYTMDEKKEMVLTYLKDKYNEEFEGISYTPKQWGQGHDEFYVYPKESTKEDAFVVWAYFHKDGTYIMSDSYFGIIIHDEYEKVMRGIVSEFYDEFNISVNAKSQTPYSDRYNKKTKISELYQKGETHGVESWTNIRVKYSSAKDSNVVEVLQQIAEKMKERNLEGQITAYIVRDDKYEYYISNLGKIKIDDKDDRNYFVFEENKNSPRYDVTVYENTNTGNIEIRNYEEGK